MVFERARVYENKITMLAQRLSVILTTLTTIWIIQIIKLFVHNLYLPSRI